MDSLDLLAREDEFKKLNKQLEKKTESLMKQIEHAMQKQDIFSEFSHNLTLSPRTTQTTVKHCCNTTETHSTPIKTKQNAKKTAKESLNNANSTVLSENKNGHVNKNLEEGRNNCFTRYICECCATESRKERIGGDLEFLHAFVSVSVQEKVMPASFLKDKVSVENVCKFLCTKVKLLQEQIDRMQTTINKKASQCEIHMTHQAQLEEERLTILTRSKNYEASAAEMKARCLAMKNKIEEKDRLYKEQRSETDKLSSEVKRLRAKNANVEAKCASLEDTVTTLKHQLETAKNAEKDLRDSMRSLASSQDSAISRLEARIKSLTTLTSRQERLIYNLKEQRALLTTEGALKALEAEYSAFLMKDF